MLGYVSRKQLRRSQRQALPSYLIGDTTGKQYKLVYMRYPSKMVCASCATTYLIDVTNTESIIPYYLVNHDTMCRDCGTIITPCEEVSHA